MGWWRRLSGRQDPPARHAARWAEPALPPATPVVTPPVTPPATPVVTAVEPVPGVRLGFVDGTQVELDRGHPSARALRAIADLLVQEHPDRAENSCKSALQVAEGP
jgi:hypothetical protein